ncbi:Sec-independent protein translocase protein TatB [Arenimonas sp.]|uniref:Sec-independent protein translocase protein TatB n=1 Tax=Arenimonas sp. TaxID=1872635 RepID=UPI0035B35834
MFDLGFSELLVIAVVALVVLGPQRLPKAARFAGLWVRKARAQWYSVKSEFEREMAAEDLKRSIGDPARDLRGDVEDIRRELDETSAQTGSALREAEASARDDARPAPDDTRDTPTQPSLLPPRRDD